MSNKVSALNSKRNKLIADAQVLVNAGKAKTEEYRATIKGIDDTTAHIDMLARADKYFESQPKPAVVPATVAAPESKEQRKAKLSASYRHYLKHGHQPGSPEQRDLLTTSDGSGAALIPQEYDSVYHSALKFYGPVATLVSQRNDGTGRSQKFTVSDDTSATMTYISEDGSSTGVEADPTLQSHIQGTDSLVTAIKFSLQMLEDANAFGVVHPRRCGIENREVCRVRIDSRQR